MQRVATGHGLIEGLVWDPGRGLYSATSSMAACTFSIAPARSRLKFALPLTRVALGGS